MARSTRQSYGKGCRFSSWHIAAKGTGAGLSAAGESGHGGRCLDVTPRMTTRSHWKMLQIEMTFLRIVISI